MAKKTSKTKKGKSKGKKPSQKLIRQVFGECAVAVGRGIEATAIEATAKDNAVSISAPESDAIAYWAERYWKTIPKGLRKGNWSIDRTAVLLQARDMGTNAAQAALKKPGKGGKIAITLSDAEAASALIESDKRCQPVPDRKGRGRYCDPKYVP
jgi:hypothetical protein